MIDHGFNDRQRFLRQLRRMEWVRRLYLALVWLSIGAVLGAILLRKIT